MTNQFETIIISSIDAVERQAKLRPLNLGGVSGYSGGIGSPPGGFRGRLPQSRVAFDLSEEESDVIPSGGASLVTNLNRIRARIATLESATPSGGGGGVTYIDQIGGTSDTYSNLIGDVDGVNTDFQVSSGSYTSGNLILYVNGQLQTQGVSEDWIELVPASGTLRMNYPPYSGSTLTAIHGEPVGGLPATFTSLSDTPPAFSGYAGYSLTVSESESDVEFVPSTLRRVLVNNIVVLDTYCMILSEYVDLASYTLTLEGDAVLEVI